MKALIFATLVLAVQGHWFDFSRNWNALRVTWGLNPFDPWDFDKLPRTLADNGGVFQLRDDQCAEHGKFAGQRYWYKSDPALTLLYDVNGYIAGIQTSAPKSKFTPSKQLKDKNYIDDGDFWTLTAYFVDPSTICHDGRSADEFANNGTGTGLWFQTGPNPATDHVEIPLTEAEAKKTKWGSGKCFWTMGMHYWHNVSKTMDCGDFVPNCLLYNDGKLTAFCFAINGVLDSKRYEHPTNKVVPKFLDPVPDCFYSDKTYETLSTMHIYFVESPRAVSRC